MICPKCGAMLQSETSFCPTCGEFLGVTKCPTCGLFGFGWLIDFFSILFGSFRDKYGFWLRR